MIKGAYLQEEDEAMSLRTALLALSIGCLVMCSVPAALADDVSVNLTFDDYTPQTGTHEDADPFKGYFNLTVTNNMSEPWGDFHFEINDVGYDVTNVFFVVDSPYEPTSSQSGLTWDVHNELYESTLDLFFYSDPVLPSETATFTVYTYNSADEVAFFGWCLYPTPVPEPVTLSLLALGGLLVVKGRR
jgi:hypothetical protein